METKSTKFTISIRLDDFIRYSNETDDSYEQRLKEEGKKRARYYLSGYLFDPSNKNIFEEVSFEKTNLNK